MKKAAFIFFNFLFFSFIVSAEYKDVKSYQDHVNNLKYKEINGKKISYIDEGHGEAVVLMHGIPTNSWMYRKVIPLLINKGYRVIAPDLLGMGQSEKVKKEKELLIQNQAKIMLSLLVDKLGLAYWRHVVHDFGGPITWEMMKDDRFQIKELILTNTFAFKDGFHPGPIKVMGPVYGLINRIAKKAFYSRAISSMISNKDNLNKKMKEGYIKPLREGGAYTYKCLYKSVPKVKKNLEAYQNNLRSFREKGVVIKLLWGEKDKTIRSKQAWKFIDEIGISKENASILRNANHLVAEEVPEDLANLIDQK